MAGFEVTEFINRSPEEVFNFLTDSSNACKLWKDTKSIEKLTPGPLGIGTRYRGTRMLHGQELQAELEVTKYNPSNEYSVTSEMEGIKGTYHYTLRPEGEGTRIDLVVDIWAGGLKKIMVPFVSEIMLIEDTDHLKALKSAMQG